MGIEEEIKSKFKNEYQKLAVNIHLTSARIGENFQSELKKKNLTRTQYNVLRILRVQNKDSVCIGLIKERMIDRNSDVSRIIDRLHKKKLINRTENKEDRRLRDILISNKGLDLLADLDQYEQLFESEFNHLDIKEINTLNNLLDKLRSK